MDLIYANQSREDIGVLKDYALDLAFGKDENDFECEVDIESNCCSEDFLLYIEGTEYGGIVDTIKIDTEAKKLTYCGRTWTGILGSKVLKPDAGEDYLIVNGETNTVLRGLIARMGLDGLFAASVDDSGIVVSNYKFNRYTDGYTGILKMLESVNAKLKIKYNGGSVVLSAEPLIDYSQNEEFDSSQVSFSVEKHYNMVNHLICLGSGELSERQVVHLYADAEGNISTTQSIFGVDEVEKTFDYPNAESADDLVDRGKERFEELRNLDTINIDFDANQDYDIGDIVGARENLTGVFMAKPIEKKIVTIKSGLININYKIGE